MEQKSDELKTLVKYGQIDLIWKLTMTGLFMAGGYFGYLYINQKSEEFQQTISEYKKKLAKIPFVGSSFRES